MNNKLPLLIVIALIALIINSVVYTVNEKEKAILFKLGEIKDADIAPGLHFKAPF